MICHYVFQMEDDKKLRLCARALWHLSQLEKCYKIDKLKSARGRQVTEVLTSTREAPRAVDAFVKDDDVVDTFVSTAKNILAGHISRKSYYCCLGLMAARLMSW